MWSRPSSAGWSPQLSAWLLACLLLALSVPTISAQSTTSAPQQPDMKPKSVLVWPQDLLTLRAKIVSLQADSQTLGEQLATLREQLNASETIQQTLSDTLTASSIKLESLTQASEAPAALDQKAIDEARGQNMAWAGGGFLVGSVLTAITVFVFHK